MNAAFDSWLAWQAEIGTDEVVLAAPPKFPQVAAAGRHTPASGPEARAPSPRPAASGTNAVNAAGAAPRDPAPAGPDFFANIAAELAKASSPGASRRGGGTTSREAAPAADAASPPSSSPLARALAELPGLDALRRFVAEEYPRWFPAATGPAAEALGHAAPRLAVVELAPGPEGLFAGEPGALLDRMLGAIGLDRTELYLTAVMKTPPPGGRAWARRDVARMLPVLERELTLARCERVLLLGEACAQAVLRTGRALPELSGVAVDADGRSFSATWHPADLLADESLKKPAWEHLKWLQTRLPRKT